MKPFLLLLLCTLTFFRLFAQLPTQKVKGRITDKRSHQPLTGAVVSVLNNKNEAIFSVQTDTEGYFTIEKVEVGRQTFKVSYLGYQSIFLQDVLVISAKELVLNGSLEESVTEMDEISVSAYKKNETVNDMAILSARSFSVEDADKYAASRQDPARMAGNFAGVNSTSDARNDIVIRGNSPQGILWRLNGVDIPNPNHFSVAGSTGGPLSIINTKFLATSDFMTGAFPAEYGNGIAGVFDLKMRNGNQDKHEFTSQIGLLGVELAAEGPLNKSSRASYLITSRYSTFQLLQGLKLKIGTDAVPKYGDGSFRFNFPTRKAGTFALFGIGGLSAIDIVLSTSNDKPKELYGDQNTDQYFRTGMGVVGLQHQFSFSEKMQLNTVLAQSGQFIRATNYLIYRDTDYRLTGIAKNLSSYQSEFRTSLNQTIGYKRNAQQSWRAGYFLTLFNFSLNDSVRYSGTADFNQRANTNGAFFYMIQPYIQWKYRISERFTFHLGLHGLYANINTNSFALEPRLGFNWQFKENQSLSLGCGTHSQLQTNYIYFAQNVSTYQAMNRDLGVSRSQHFVCTYDNLLSKNLRIKIEPYYQYLWGIPIYAYGSNVSLINQGASFSRYFPKSTLVNQGLGQNYGIEFTLEKFYSKNYYLLWTTSLYHSIYKANDEKWRNTDYNGNYITNLLAGYELPVGKKKTTVLVSGFKFTYAGGKRYSPADLDSSRKYADYQIKEDSINTLRFSDYMRLDLRLGFRINAKKITHELMIDLVNVLGIKNPLSLTYAPDFTNPTANPIIVNYQLGFLPLLYYKIDF
jgi:CarboxypepD_reg-like domain/TonB-dependent Receptor Plug Domain